MSLSSFARAMKRDVVALWIAARNTRVPWYAKALAAIVAAYALSPIDLIPDFIPVLGLLDDLILVPIGIWIVLRMIPPALMQEFRQAAERAARPVSQRAAVLIVLIWIASAIAIGWIVWEHQG